MRFSRRLHDFRGESWVYRHTAYPGEQLDLIASYETRRFSSDKPQQGRLYRRGYARGEPWKPSVVSKPERF